MTARELLEIVADYAEARNIASQNPVDNPDADSAADQLEKLAESFEAGLRSLMA